MRNKTILTIIAFLICFPATLYAGSWEGKVVSVTDGDTIKVLQGGTQVKIRLAAIDCPEKGQPYGQAARKFTADLVAGKIVKVWPTDTDRYGRIVAFVFADGIDLNKELLKAGMAWHYQQYSRDPELAKLEFQARAKKVGLWSEPDPVPPWEYRGSRNDLSIRQNMSSVVKFKQPLNDQQKQDQMTPPLLLTLLFRVDYFKPIILSVAADPDASFVE